jgi:hypothetical protein
MKQKNDIIKQPMKNINTMKIMKKFLFLKICLFTLYSPTIFAITCSTGSGGSSGSYSWKEITDSAAFSALEGHSSVVFNNKMWVVGGYGIVVGSGGFKSIDPLNQVWSSEDGVTWEEVTKDSSKKFPVRQGQTSVVFDDDTGEGEKIWLIGGLITDRLNDVWNSADGKDWTKVRRSGATGGFAIRNRHASVVFDKKMWVLGGSQNNGVALDDVWSSTNGITWREVTRDSSKKFSSRYEHSSVVFDARDGKGEKIWVFGGRNSSSNFDDVWSSTDGKTWTEETKDSSKKFSARHGHQSVVFDNKMWVFGGNLSSGSFDTVNDVWSSTDGKNWTKVRSDDDTSGFTARTRGASVFFKGKVWLIAGRQASSVATYLNDVWSMTKD